MYLLFYTDAALRRGVGGAFMGHRVVGLGEGESILPYTAEIAVGLTVAGVDFVSVPESLLL